MRMDFLKGLSVSWKNDYMHFYNNYTSLWVAHIHYSVVVYLTHLETGDCDNIHVHSFINDPATFTSIWSMSIITETNYFIYFLLLNIFD